MPAPLDFENRYRRLDVKLDDKSTVRVDVHKYLLNGNNNADALAAKDKLIFEKIRPDAKKSKAPVKVDATPIDGAREAAIARCYMGKGSPEDLALTLRLVNRYGLASAARGLQGYSDDYLGLDCNGFVGNYTKACGLAGPGPSSDMEVFYANGTARTRIEDVAARDILIWKHKTGTYGHIAVIDVMYYGPWDPAHKHFPRCVVVESSGGAGLHHSDYTLQSAVVEPATRRTVFTVGRANGSRHKVYIVNLRL